MKLLYHIQLKYSNLYVNSSIFILCNNSSALTKLEKLFLELLLRTISLNHFVFPEKKTILIS